MNPFIDCRSGEEIAAAVLQAPVRRIGYIESSIELAQARRIDPDDYLLQVFGEKFPEAGAAVRAKGLLSSPALRSALRAFGRDLVGCTTQDVAKEMVRNGVDIKIGPAPMSAEHYAALPSGVRAQPFEGDRS